MRRQTHTEMEDAAFGQGGGGVKREPRFEGVWINPLEYAGGLPFVGAPLTWASIFMRPVDGPETKMGEKGHHWQPGAGHFGMLIIFCGYPLQVDFQESDFGCPRILTYTRSENPT